MNNNGHLLSNIDFVGRIFANKLSYGRKKAGTYVPAFNRPYRSNTTRDCMQPLHDQQDPSLLLELHH